MKKKFALSLFLLFCLFLLACNTGTDSSSGIQDQEIQETFAAEFVDTTLNSTLKSSFQYASDSGHDVSEILETDGTKSKGKSSLAEPLDLSDGFTIHDDEENGLKVNMGFNVDASEPGLFFMFFFNDHCAQPPAEEGDEAASEECTITVTGDLKITIAFNGDIDDPQLGLVLNTEEPLVFTDSEGGMMDGADLEFQDFTLWFSLLEDSDEPVKEMSGKVILNGMEIDLDLFEGLDFAELLSGL